MEKKADYVFEVAWEVCNKVGGIYTVVRSKAPQMLEYYKSNYFLIGPYFSDKASHEFSQEVPDRKLKQVFDKLKQEGITAYYGRWLIKGKPSVILLDFNKFSYKKNDIKAQMWSDYKIDSLNSPPDYDEPVIWSMAVGRLLEELSSALKGRKVAHFHEWLSGAAILYLKKKNIRIRTVFTTHATVLGRTLTGSDIDLYRKKDGKCVLELMDIEKEAYKHVVQAKHQLEKAAAQNARVFTTVSEITALEAEHILKRKPDILTPNGLDFHKLPNLEEVPIQHKVYKSKIREFLISYVLPHYPIDVENTLIFVISGRYEFRNKGIDVTIRALGKLNKRMKQEDSKKTVVVFFFIPAGTKTINRDIIENRAMFEDVEDFLDDNLKDVREKIMYGISVQKLPDRIKLFDEDFLLELRDKLMSFEKDGDPPVVTHELTDEKNDLILKGFREAKLYNKKMDRVKVIFYPCYLSSSDGLLDMDYNTVVWGSHLGVFPSYYEPWGYTPLECAAYGVPSITTDLTGFGRFVLKNSKDETGIFVIRREGEEDDEVVKQLAERMYWYVHLSKEDRIKYKIKAENFAPMCSWAKLVQNYIKAHNKAVEKIK